MYKVFRHHFPVLTTTKQPVPSVTSVALGTTVASAKASSSIKRPPVSATTPTAPPPPPAQPAPPSLSAAVAPTSAAASASVVSSAAASRTSSFAAALRNLAKNATSVANEPPPNMASSVASPASVTSVASVPEPPALLDVRRVSHFYTQEWLLLLQSDWKKLVLTSQNKSPSLMVGDLEKSCNFGPKQVE